ncbi:MAG: TA system VapC family ribonuclease toxin, partial [Candidatus Methylacidiphilales bacterium]
EDAINHGYPIRLFPAVEQGFLRIVTHPKIYSAPTPLKEACSFLDILCSAPSVEITQWTPSVRKRWIQLCLDLKLQGNDCNDAMLAALAIEKSLRLVTFDQGFERFPGLRLLLLIH